MSGLSNGNSKSPSSNSSQMALAIPSGSRGLGGKIIGWQASQVQRIAQGNRPTLMKVMKQSSIDTNPVVDRHGILPLDGDTCVSHSDYNHPAQMFQETTTLAASN